MKAGFHVEIALNSGHSDLKNNTAQPLLWLQKMIPLLLFSVLLINIHQVQAQAATVNIKKAIDVALANNYGLQADSLNMTVTGFQNKQLSGYFLPQVQYGNQFAYNIQNPSQMLPGTIAGQSGKDYVPVEFGTKYNVNGGIEVSQLLFRKDLSIRIKAADLNTAIAQTKYKLTKEELIYKVSSAFYDLQSSAENIRTTTHDHNNLQEVLTIARSQYEHGTLKRVEYETLQINVANKKSQLNQMQAQYDQLLYYFKYLTGISADANIHIDEGITLLPNVTVNTAEAITQRKDLLLTRQLTKAKEVELKSIKAEGAPQISSFFKYNYQAQFSEAGDIFDSYYRTNSSSFGITISTSLFDGNRRKNRANAARTQIQQLKRQIDYQQQQVKSELLSAVQKLNTSRRQFDINAENLELAEKVFDSRKALYAEGVTSLVELINAENELTKARNLYTQSLINVQTGTLDVHKANGTLLTGFLKSI